MKRTISALVCFIILLFTISAHAATDRIQPKGSSLNKVQSTVDPSDVYPFKSVDDEGRSTSGLPIRSKQASGYISNHRTYNTDYTIAGYNNRIYADGDRLDYRVFVRYLTGSWVYSDRYLWSLTNTTSWSYGGNATFGEKVRVTLGLSRSRSTSYGVTIQIPEIVTLESKLAFGSDYFLQNFYVHRDTINQSGAVTATQYYYDDGYTYTPTEDSYLYVKYR